MTDGSAAPTGPASYLPSIEKTYGRPIERWLGLVRQQHAAGTSRHGELVSWLKSGLRHGHANTVVARTLGELEAEA